MAPSFAFPEGIPFEKEEDFKASPPPDDDTNENCDEDLTEKKQWRKIEQL